MRPMRRVVRLLLAAGWLGLLAAPVVAGPAVLAQVNPPDVTSDACVGIGLPVLSANLPGTCTTTAGQPGISNDPATGGAIVNYVRQWLYLLNLAVPGVILLMIIIAAVQYLTAGANPTSVKSAKSRLINAMIGLVLWLMMFAILQFLVPGGIL